MDPTFPLSAIPLSSSSSSVSSSVAPTSTTTPTPAPLTLNTVSDASTCNPLNISWSYTGDDSVSVSLDVVNGVVLRTGPMPELFLNKSIATVDASAGNYVWSEVDVHAGWYKVQAIIPSYTAESPSFFVSNGTSSCFAPVSSSTPLPVSAAASGLTPSQRAGAIAGGVIGGVVVIVAALLALSFLRNRKRRQQTRVPGPSDAKVPHDMQKWNELSPRNSEVGLPIAKDASGNMQLQKMSYESSTATASNVGHADGAATGDVSEASTLNDEERPNRRSEYIETVPPLPYSQSARSLALANLDGSSPSPRHASRRSVDASAYPLSPLSADALAPPLSADMDRSSSGSAVGRRLTRKPVPQYGDVHAGAAEPVSSLESPARMHEDLAHKTSFGNMRPMHVIMPDMPPPSYD